jgi:hypothetical protein
VALFTFSHTIIAFHSIHLFLCLQQTGEIDNLIVSWEQSSWLCCVQVPHCCWRIKALDEAPYNFSRAVAKLASITFWSLAFSYWTDKPWFLTEGKFATVLIIPSSWASQLDGDLHQHRAASRMKEEKLT